MTTFTRLMTSLCLLLKADTETRTLNRLITNQLRHQLRHISIYIYLFSISTYKKSRDISHDSLSGTILTFPIFLCHLKIGIIKESSIAPLSKSRDYSIFPIKISFCGHSIQKEPCNRSHKTL